VDSKPDGLSSMDEDELIRAIQGGEQELYAVVIRKYQQQLYVYCYHLLMQREEAEDALQDVFLKGYEKLNLYKPGASFSAWLYKIAYHHCVNLLHKRRRTELLHMLLKPLRNHSVDDGYAFARRKEVRALSVSSLQRLSPLERSLIVLRVVEGRSYEEIGRMYSYSQAALRKKVERAKSKLKKIWIELEGDEDEFAQTNISATKQELVRGAATSD